MAQIIIDISAARVTWPGSWQRIICSGIPIGIRRNPVRDIARMLLQGGRVEVADLIFIRLECEIIDTETIAGATALFLRHSI
jgi:hypothetical protein